MGALDFFLILFYFIFCFFFVSIFFYPSVPKKYVTLLEEANAFKISELGCNLSKIVAAFGRSIVFPGRKTASLEMKRILMP